MFSDVLYLVANGNSVWIVEFFFFNSFAAGFHVLLTSRLAGSILYSYHVKYLAEYKELIMGIYSEGIIAV